MIKPAKADVPPQSGSKTAEDAAIHDHDLEAARRVLTTEARAIEGLAARLDGRFSQAVDVLAAVGGRVIVTGMGKCNHIANKIAATFASTGTPAHFVHPAEASHGDLGMITEADAVLVLSNSGETTELSDILAYTSRFRIPLVGLTGKGDSTLAKAADVALVLPDAPEACPMGLAPTTSTSVMLALGDALAVALLERKGFSADDFYLFHPGGKLGSQLRQVGELMHRGEEMPLINVRALMSAAWYVMSEKGFGCVGVIGEDGVLIGMITDGDLRRNFEPALFHKPVAEIMTRDPLTVRADMLAGEALHIMNERKITMLFVVDDASRPAGILHVHDFLRAGV